MNKKNVVEYESKRTQDGMLRAVIASGFFTALGIGIVSFVLPLISKDVLLDGAWLGAGFAGFFFVRMIAGPIGGILADRGSPRIPLLLGTTLGALVPILYIFYPSTASLYFIQVTLGCASGLIRPVGLAIIGGAVSGDRASKWFSAHALAFQVAMFLGPIVGGVLYWYRTPGPVLIGLVLCMVVANCLIIARGSSFLSKIPSSKTQSGGGASDLPRLLLAIFGRSLGIGVYTTFYPILVSTRLGVESLSAGLLYATPFLVTCLALSISWVVHKFVKDWFVVVGMGLSALGILCIGFSESIWQFLLLGCVIGLGSALSLPGSMRLASTTSANQGRLFGITHVVTGAGFILGPILGTIIVKFFGDIGLVFNIVGVLGGFCLLGWGLDSGWRRAYYPPTTLGRWVRSAILMALCAVMVVSFLPHMHPKERDEELYKFTDMAMGTVVNLTLVSESQKHADDAAQKAMAFMRAMQHDLDFRSSEGSVGRINHEAGQQFIKPTTRVYELISRMIEYSAKTKGVFDPSIGAVTTSPLYYVLDETIAQSKKDLVNYRFIDLDTVGKRVRLRKHGMALDLGGVAKGTIIDATVKLLKKLNIKSGIVEAGGDFYCFGDREWTIGVRHPRNEQVYSSIKVREKGVCGSGDYEQFVRFEKNGKKQLRHHILDPSTMESADRSIGVTVIADNAEMADAIATTLFIMGPKTGLQFLTEEFSSIAALWFTSEGQVIRTDNFPQ